MNASVSEGVRSRVRALIHVCLCYIPGTKTVWVSGGLWVRATDRRENELYCRIEL